MTTFHTASDAHHLKALLIILIPMLWTFVFLKLEKKRFSDIGLSFEPKTALRFMQGLLLGLVVIGALFLSLFGITALEYEILEAPKLFQAIVLSFITFFGLAFMEELVFRGYALQSWCESIGTRYAIYLSSIIFGLYHGISLNSLLGPGIWGLIFCVAALWSKGLAFPTGFHLSLNWVQAMFGMKTDWAAPIWELSIDTEKPIIHHDHLGLIQQVLILVIAIFLIEKVRQNKVPSA